ncbi:MAG: hypothetical protein RR662_07300 [Clostridia bacterium]
MYNYSCNSCHNSCECNVSSCEVSCQQYKCEADKLYAEAAILADKAKCAFSESDKMLAEAKCLEKKLMELVEMANCKCQEANQAQQQSNYLLDLASNVSKELSACLKKCNQCKSCDFNTIDIVPVKPQCQCSCSCSSKFSCCK